MESATSSALPHACPSSAAAPHAPAPPHPPAIPTPVLPLLLSLLVPHGLPPELALCIADYLPAQVCPSCDLVSPCTPSNCMSCRHPVPPCASTACVTCGGGMCPSCARAAGNFRWGECGRCFVMGIMGVRKGRFWRAEEGKK